MKQIRTLPIVTLLAWLLPMPTQGACCYFAAKDKDVNQPSQKAFICWDPVEKMECFTVQPKFEGNAPDFGMVIPTPGRPKLDEMPRDFFKELAVFTILSKRTYPQSKLLPMPMTLSGSLMSVNGAITFGSGTKKPAVRVLESGIVGSLDYKIIQADKADDLYDWLKANNYNYGGDQATLDHYIKKGWFFTTMKIDSKQMKKGADGSYLGEVTPTRFQFNSEQLVYPLKITQLSVKDTTEALLYVQAPYKCDLPGDLTYQYQWLPSLQASMGCTPEGLPGHGNDWLVAVKDQIPGLLERGAKLGYGFVGGQRPQPNAQGRIATTLEWAKPLSQQDMDLLAGKGAFGQTVPDVDQGFTQADLEKGEKEREAVYQAIMGRIEKDRKEHPGGYLVREAPAEDVQKLKLLAGHLKKDQWVTKLRKSFTKGEMEDDLLIIPAELAGKTDKSEYTELLPTSPP